MLYLFSMLEVPEVNIQNLRPSKGFTLCLVMPRKAQTGIIRWRIVFEEVSRPAECQRKCIRDVLSVRPTQVSSSFDEHASNIIARILAVCSKSASTEHTSLKHKAKQLWLSSAGQLPCRQTGVVLGGTLSLCRRIIAIDDTRLPKISSLRDLSYTPRLDLKSWTRKAWMLI